MQAKCVHGGASQALEQAREEVMTEGSKFATEMEELRQAHEGKLKDLELEIVNEKERGAQKLLELRDKVVI